MTTSFCLNNLLGSIWQSLKLIMQEKSVPYKNTFYECASSLNSSILWCFNVRIKVLKSSGINHWVNVYFRCSNLSNNDQIKHL